MAYFFFHFICCYHVGFFTKCMSIFSIIYFYISFSYYNYIFVF